MSALASLRNRLEDQIRQGKRMSFPFDQLAAVVVPLFQGGMRRRLQGARTRVDARVISFGNLTTGGTGKTPAVIARAQQEVAAGRRVAVLTRGYGSQPVEEPFLVGPDWRGEGKPLYQIIGDEPALIRKKVPEAAVVKTRDRVAGAQAAIAAGYDTLILDDGYQAVALERDENILLIDATNPWGNGFLLPRGMLREQPEAAVRATAVYLTRCDQANGVEELEQRLRLLAPNAPILRTRHATRGLWNIRTGQRKPVEWLRGQKVRVACAIGNADSFVATITLACRQLVTCECYPDHAEIPLKAFDHKGIIVVTEKDAVRLLEPPANVWALEVGLELL